MAQEVINGKVVSRWFRRGKARIPIFEDGTIGFPKKASDISRNEYQHLKDEIAISHKIENQNTFEPDDETIELDRKLETRFNQNEYKRDISDLEGKHIQGREARAKQIDLINLDKNIRQELTNNLEEDAYNSIKLNADKNEFYKTRAMAGVNYEKTKEAYSKAQEKYVRELNREERKIIREELKRESKEAIGNPPEKKGAYDKRTSTELRKQLKELEPYTQELQIGNRVIVNTGGGRYGVRGVGDESDPMTDYSAYVYGFNAKSIIQRAREQGIVTDTPKTSKTTETKIERFKERKGKTLDTMSKRQLAEKLVEDQIARGVIKSENKEMQIKRKMNDYSKNDLLKYFE